MKKLLLVILLFSGCDSGHKESSCILVEEILTIQTLEDPKEDVEDREVVEVEEVVVAEPRQSDNVNPYEDVTPAIPQEEILPCEDLPEVYQAGGEANPYGVYPTPSCKALKVLYKECE